MTGGALKLISIHFSKKKRGAEASTRQRHRAVAAPAIEGSGRPASGRRRISERWRSRGQWRLLRRGLGAVAARLEAVAGATGMRAMRRRRRWGGAEGQVLRARAVCDQEGGVKSDGVVGGGLRRSDDGGPTTAAEAVEKEATATGLLGGREEEGRWGMT